MNMSRPVLALVLLFSLSGNADAINRLGRVFDFGKKVTEANQDISEPEEIEIGTGLTAGLLGAAPLVADDELQRYVNQVGRWLSLHTERPDLPWRFGILDTDAVNAFAIPGGTILITRGLYDRLRDESELAGVLAHEIAHVLQKHQLAAIQKELGKEWQSEVAGEVIARSSNEWVVKYGDRAFAAGREVMTRGLDKKDEYEADRMGVIIAARSGYNPFGLVGVLHTLDATDAEDKGVALMFSTHPTAHSRLLELDTAIGTQLDGLAEKSSTPSLKH